MRRSRAYMLSKHPKFYARLIGEYPPVPIVNQESDSSGSLNLRIPNVVYQTWETNKLGKTHYKQFERFRKINPEFNFILFSSRQMHEYMEEFYGRHPIYEIYRNGIFLNGAPRPLCRGIMGSLLTTASIPKCKCNANT